MKALTTPIAELAEKISVLKEKIQSVEEDEKDILFVFKGETKEVFEKFQKDYEDFMGGNYKDLESAMEKYFAESTALSTGELIEKSREYITEETIYAIDAWKKEEFKQLAQISERITGKLILASVEKAAQMRQQGETAGRDKIETLKGLSSALRDMEAKIKEL